MNQYDNPLITRYASPEMSRIWSPDYKFSTWRKLWIALAKVQKELGVDITSEQITAMEAAAPHINYTAAAEYEKKFRHDVMAHIHAFADDCPIARPIIHLGATSCFVCDNTELIQIRDSLRLIINRLSNTLFSLSDFAMETRDIACLGFTHLQVAQPTTIGKRASLWAYDLLQDLQEASGRYQSLSFRGAKGTTGTQASFLTIFKGDMAKVRLLEEKIASQVGFPSCHPITGQTYPRKVDSQVLFVLNQIAQSCHKAGTDIRILQHRRELSEPFGKDQVGSSAMAYKRNPMKSERMCSLAKFVMAQQTVADNIAATQWMERTLDDSAARRIILPQTFLATEACLILYEAISKGLNLNQEVIDENLNRELPFLATEEVIAKGVEAGRDRQELHERIRQYSGEGTWKLFQKMNEDPYFRFIDFTTIDDPKRYIGMAPQQVEYFIHEFITPLRTRVRQNFGEVKPHEITV